MRSYLARQDVRRSCSSVIRKTARYKTGGGNPILRAAQTSRAWMQNAICRGLDDSPEVQNFLSGIVLGIAARNARRHRRAVSANWHDSPFRRRWIACGNCGGAFVGAGDDRASVTKARNGIHHSVALFYAAVTGLHISALRAAVMASILVGSYSSNEEFSAKQPRRGGVFSFCAGTRTNFFHRVPTFLRGGWRNCAVGRSVLQTVAAACGSGSFSAAKPGARSTPMDASSYEWLCGGASVSLAAWIGSLPLILWYFHWSRRFLCLANLVVVPIAFFVLAVALLSLIATPLLPWVAIVFNNANWTLATLVIGIVHLFAQIPGGHFYVGEPDWGERISAKMTVLDLGAGAAVHVRANGHDWLFDCGSERSYERIVRQYLHWAGVNRLTGLVLTHGDSQHIGGITQLLSDFPRVRVIDNPAPDRSAHSSTAVPNSVGTEGRGRKPVEVGCRRQFSFVPRSHRTCFVSAPRLCRSDSGRSSVGYPIIHRAEHIRFVHVGQRRQKPSARC